MQLNMHKRNKTKTDFHNTWKLRPRISLLEMKSKPKPFKNSQNRAYKTKRRESISKETRLTLVSRGLIETARVRTRTSLGLRSGTSTIGRSSRTSGPPKRGSTTALQAVTMWRSPTFEWLDSKIEALKLLLCDLSIRIITVWSDSDHQRERLGFYREGRGIEGRVRVREEKSRETCLRFGPHSRRGGSLISSLVCSFFFFLEIYLIFCLVC